MKFVIVTGISGAGKNTALKILEDVGYFCMDNIPLALVEKFAELCGLQENGYSQVALSIDVRSGIDGKEFQEVLERLLTKGIQYEILFIEASDSTLLKRYKESRRSHPLARDGRLEEGIRLEREVLSSIKDQANYIIDTSKLLVRELRTEMEKIFVSSQEYHNIFITVLSFGFKYGIPVDSDLVFDVRFLPNPYYEEALRPRTGQEREVQDYVMKNGMAEVFLEKLEDMIEFLLPQYVSEGKNQLVISIGCTGGQHRSVTIAEHLYQHLKKHAEYGLKLEHRDIAARKR